MRWHVVNIGGIPVGRGYPIRIQSMTTTDPKNVHDTVREIIQLVNAGCDYVRVTVPNRRSAEAIRDIKKELRFHGYGCVPIIADVHFAPHLAKLVAPFVEKVRINPGNFADRKTLEGPKKDWTDSEWKSAISKIADELVPLLKICKENGTALRIGVNYGSLSDRILWKWGNTPEGMVESALEYLDICEDFGFDQIVISMKASNPLIMIEANKLLLERLKGRGHIYPIHLGVTEAGNGYEGRIRSMIGIATLLSQGIGDTIRVSLAEDPVNEVYVIKNLIRLMHEKCLRIKADAHSSRVQAGSTISPIVILTVRNPESLSAITPKPDYGVTQEGLVYSSDGKVVGMITSKTTDGGLQKSFSVDGKSSMHIIEGDETWHVSTWIESIQAAVDYGIEPGEIILRVRIPANGYALAMMAGAIIGPVLMRIPVGGIWLESPYASPDELSRVTFGILQSARLRTDVVEYIACPSCGRTLFNLQEVVERVRKKTSHLRGIKIAVMGCVVNGLGEIADADYGYIGSGPGRVNLYRGKKLVKRNVPEAQAIDELINLIKEDGRWTDPA